MAAEVPQVHSYPTISLLRSVHLIVCKLITKDRVNGEAD